MRKHARDAKAPLRRCRWESMEILEPRVLLSAALDAAASAAAALSAPAQVRQVEYLDRGVVAVRSGSNAFVSWRLLALDPSNIGFNVYRSANGGAAVKLNGAVLTAGTNYTDASATMTVDNVYSVRPVVNGVERTADGSYTLKANTTAEPCVVVPLRTPLTGYYTKFVWVGDLDGDGKYDYVVDRLAPGDPNNANLALGPQYIEAYKSDGTFLWSVNFGPNSLNVYNITPGSSSISTGQNDGVAVYDLDGDGKAEVVIKTANGVVLPDGTTVTNSNDNVQYLTVLNGMTGAVRATLQMPTDYLSVGQLAFRTAIAYFNGATPSIVGVLENRNADKSFNYMVCAWDFNGTALSLRWKWLRGNQNCPDGHQFRIADVDGDGKDEYLDNGTCLNSDGTLRYTLGPAGIVHGDRFDIGKFDPNRPGLQGYGIQQNNASGLLEYYFDASTGEILWEHFTTPPAGDVGRGVVGDVDPRYPGFETWSFSGVYNGPTNTQLTTGASLYPCQTFWWDGDLLSDGLNDGKFEKWNYTSQTVSRLLTLWTFEGATGTGSNPLFMGDIFGDWRTEAVYATPDFAKLVIFTTDIASSYRMYSLAQDPSYRAQMTTKGYYEMPLPDFYLGSGMTTPSAPIVSYIINDPTNAAPTVATPAAASPKPVTAFTTNLSVLGADDGGEANLIYNWSAVGPAPVSFSVNGVNGAKNTVATFTKAGVYYFTALISDAKGQSTLSNVTVTVSQTQTGLTLAPLTPTVIATGTQQFTASAYDQFNNPLSPQPTMTWTVTSGSGTVNSTGLYTAPSAAGTAVVQVACGGFVKTASVTIKVGLPTIASAASATPSTVTGTSTSLSVLGASVAGESGLTYTWVTTGTPPATVAFSVNGSNAAKNTVAYFTKAGVYSFQVTVVDLVGQSVTSTVNVTVNQTLTSIAVSPLTATMNLSGAQPFMAVGKDQFANAMSAQPVFIWTVPSGGGTIDSTGLYTAPAAASVVTVQAASGGKTGVATVYAGNIFTSDIDVGNVGLAGTTSYAGGVYTMTGSAPTDTSDGFHFASLSVTGNRTLIVHVDSQSSTTGASGLMFRKSAANNSAYVTINATDDPQNHIFFRYRTSDGGSETYAVGYQNAPVWLMLTRTSNTYFGYYSSNGVTWTLVGSVTDNGVPSTALAGLTTSSDGSTLLGTTQFSNFAVMPNVNVAPTVYYTASATPSPVTGTTTALSVLCKDEAGEGTLAYTWSTTGTPPAPVVFAINGTNAAKDTTVQFSKAGTYSFLVTAKDPGGMTITSSVSVTVSQTLTSVVLTPDPVTVTVGKTQQFSAVANDQFGNRMTAQPTFTWTATAGTVNAAGLYTAPGSGTSATITAAGGGKSDTAAVALFMPATITGRKVFYNGSIFDSVFEDNAIATDKQALLPGGTASFANITSYSLGINGIMIDIAGPASTLTAADFLLAAGNDNSPDLWPALAAAPTVINRPGAGVGGSTRIELVLPDNAVQNQWLKVTIKGGTGAASGLTADDVFYFGNAIGETGNAPASLRVDIVDQLAIRAAQTASAPITSACDINRDGRVDADDETLSRTHVTWFMSDVRLISASAIAGAAQAAEAPATASAAVASASAGSMVTAASGAVSATAQAITTPAPALSKPTVSAAALVKRVAIAPVKQVVLVRRRWNAWDHLSHFQCQIPAASLHPDWLRGVTTPDWKSV